jgi:hypothetical protein
LVLVPADPKDSTAQLARAVAEVGQRLSYAPVTAITIDSLEFGTALALADLQQHLERAVPAPQAQQTVEVTTTTTTASPDPDPKETPAAIPLHQHSQAIVIAPSARLIISIPAVISEPLGLAATQEADKVIVTVRVGRTRIADARRTIELVGRDRIAGCFLVR